MKEFRITTVVTTFITVDYLVEAKSLKEALKELKSGKLRGDGEEFDAEIDWKTEVVDSYMEIIDGEEVEIQD